MIEAKVIQHSEAAAHDKHLVTFELTYPRSIHGEILTHRAFSRNSASSRAIPIEKMIEQVETNPFVPTHIGRNRPGMQALDDLPPSVIQAAKEQWLIASKAAIYNARKLAELGVHKQIANRLLEPFQWMKTVLTTTELDNFFELRVHGDAEPHFEELARKMKEALNGSVPRICFDTNTPGSWHLPYITEGERHSGKHLQALIKSSVARCARVSYLRQGQVPDFDKDVQLFDRLVGSKPLHASPLEHQASPFSDKRWVSRNFQGWQQYREIYESSILKI